MVVKRWGGLEGSEDDRGMGLDLAGRLRWLAGFDVPLLLHVDSVIDGVLVLVIAAGGLTLLAAAKGVVCQVALIAVSMGACG